MKMLVQELSNTALDQAVTVDRNIIVKAIRPHLYRHNFPTGSLKIQILDSGASVIAESEVIAISDIKLTATPVAFLHGYVRFYINAYLKKGEQYTIRLIGQDGYTFNESAYCGWVNGFDLAKYPLTSVPASHYNYPFDFEVWERTEK
jgi:hypothetical protein